MKHLRHPYSPKYAVAFFAVTIVFGTIHVVAQQILRQSANDPQIQVAEDIANALNGGANPQALIPPQKTDMSKTLDPFLIVYDNSGAPVGSSVMLRGAIPTPPRGVFDFSRARGEDRITWQPAVGVRNATIIMTYNNGFVVVGRSLREVERREDQLMLLEGFGWFASVALLLLYGYVKSRLKLS